MRIARMKAQHFDGIARPYDRIAAAMGIKALGAARIAAATMNATDFRRKGRLLGGCHV